MNDTVVTGMVISVMPIGEYDRRVELLTVEMGRISAFARGARRPASSLVSATRVFAFGRFNLYQGRSSYSLRSADISNYFEELSADPDKMFYGFYFLELARYFSKENMEALEMMKLLYRSLQALNIKALSKRLIKSVYELKMLDINGICPSSDRLLKEKGPYAFATGMSESCRKAYDFVLGSLIEKLYTFSLSDDILQEFEAVVSNLIMMNVDKQFKSTALLK